MVTTGAAGASAGVFRLEPEGSRPAANKEGRTQSVELLSSIVLLTMNYSVVSVHSTHCAFAVLNWSAEIGMKSWTMLRIRELQSTIVLQWSKNA